MSNELREGVELDAVHLLPSGANQETMSYAVGYEGSDPYVIQCESIVICEQSGQMANVPWAKATRSIDGSVELINLANVESVALA